MARIMLVEDDPEVLLIFHEILLEAGHQVDTAETFRAAAELLASRDYDLVVSDGRLPDGTGMGLADSAKVKGIKSLIVTGYAWGLRDGDPRFNLDNYVVMRKPVSARDLQAAVSRMASGR
jgi:DNA-binding NtrC family response regulator